MRIEGPSSSSGAEVRGDRIVPDPAQRPSRAAGGHAVPQAPQEAQGPGLLAAGQGAALAARAMAPDPSAREAQGRDFERFARLVDQVCCDLRGLGALDRPPAAAEADGPVPARYVDVEV